MVDRFGGSRLTGAERFEDREAVGDQQSTGRRRWVGEELLAAEARGDRPAADDAVLLQVAFRDAPAAGADVLGDRVREVAFVEDASALLGDQLECGGEILLDQRVLGDEALAVSLVDLA
jgi:hypothetical protein